MTLFQIIFLACLQGLTEFIPVSSSGHLALAQKLFGLSSQPVAFDILLHLGTLIAVVVFFRHRLLALAKNISSEKNYIFVLALASLPAALAGFFLQSKIELLFGSLTFIGIGFAFTGFLLLSTRLISKTNIKADHVSIKNAFIIGLFQAIAIVPGISRSGSTVVSALWQKLAPGAAFDFSFLLSIPVILGAAVAKITDLETLKVSLLEGGVALLFSSLVGYFSLIIVDRLIKSTKLYYFGFYCLFLSVIVLVWSLSF